MGKYLDETLQQKFAIRNYQVFFNINDSLVAEEILDGLDRATNGLRETFGQEEEPTIEIYLFPNFRQIEKVTRKPMNTGETSRIVYEDRALLWSIPNLHPPLNERAIRETGYVIFNEAVKEQESGVNRWRSPSWLREGFCLQNSSRLRADAKEYFKAGWSDLQAAVANNQLVRPPQMVKHLHMIPDQSRRLLAIHEAFFMIRHLLTIFPDNFFKKYSTMMGAFSDMDAEEIFRRITGFDFEKFFGMFQEWVQTTSVWAALD